MTDKEQQNPPHHQRRQVPTNRARPSHSRIYQHLGVRDLREIIDRKRQERGQINECGVPPSDPSYNYLKDPLRESAEQNVQELRQTFPRKPKNNDNFKRDREHHKGQTTSQVKYNDIKNPLNIKVEFSTSTGEHVYKLDESLVLPTIKHVPDHRPVQNRSFRGRGRGRGRGPRSYHTRTIRNNRWQNESVSGKVTNAEGITPISITTEENWDDEVTKTRDISEQESQECKEYDDVEGQEEPQSELKIQQVNDDENVVLQKGIENLTMNESETLQVPCKNEECTSESI
ncbi:hypothetical protein Zmor_011167 [Zophobas morio]|uniref:Uncharacterized protein n=1 Tax=Zophobas morio TaxID=2755281 RepID=A0AA38HUQ9_9CUCU|nr:hypothetical protein Zmor_026634 [Zophobas morio]KAJ3659479.1 hypothetical protein Zmor_011167 [Zophobas morio]